MGDFDEKSGIISCATDFGLWYQTIDEVVIEIDVPKGTRAKEIKCNVRTDSIKVEVQGKVIMEGELSMIVHPKETIWTVEDQKLLRICLIKTDQTAGNCWRSLLKDKYQTDPNTYDEMERKLTMQKFQLENPGMDFSGATISGNYHGGGPDLP